MMSTERPHNVTYEPGVQGLHTCTDCGYVGADVPPLPCPGKPLTRAIDQALTLVPGSKVLVTTDRHLTRDHAQLIKDELDKQFPDVEFVLVAGVRVGAVMPPKVDIHVELDGANIRKALERDQHRRGQQ